MMKKIFYILFFAVLCGCYAEEKADIKMFSVTSCFPSNHATGISVDAHIILVFSEAADTKSIQDNFSLSSGNETVSGVHVWDNPRQMRFDPDEPLTVGKRYVARLTREAQDVYRNRMSETFYSEFTVGEDTVMPEVVSSIPIYTTGGTLDVPVTQNISITFTKPMNREKTETAFTITPTPPGYFEWDVATGSVMTYVLTSPMEYGKYYQVSVSADAEDASGNKIKSSYTLIFVTGNDFLYPAVVNMYESTSSTTLINTALNEYLSKNSTISVRFSEVMNKTSVESAFFSSPSVAGRFEWSVDSTVITFIPESPLEPEAVYTFGVSNSATDANNRKLQTGYEVIVKINAPDSLYLRIGAIKGRNADTSPSVLLYDVLNPSAVWPTPISFIDDVSNQYIFDIEVYSSTGTTPVTLDPASVYGNIKCEWLYNSLGTPTVSDLMCYNSNTVILYGLSGLYNRSAVNTETRKYRITITGGDSGVRDINGNYLKQNFTFDFVEQ